MGALAWVAITPTPGPYIKDQLDAAEFYGNKIRVEFKGKEQKQIDWVNGFKALIEGLHDYVRKNHTTGLVWNPKGCNASEVAASGAASSGGGAPPAPPKAPGPPPPPAPSAAPAASSSAAPPAGLTNALFAELSKGEAVTAGLKKVTRDMTNKDKKVESFVSADAAKPKAAAAATKAPEKEHTPVLVLDGMAHLHQKRINK
jgi:adenylyl cyclase-associated protein